LLADSGDFLTFNQFKEKYNIETMFYNTIQIILTIPSILKQKSDEQGDSQIKKTFNEEHILSLQKLINQF